MSFQSVVLIISSIILLLTLLVVTYLIYIQKNSMLWPPEISQCPDYWKVVGNNRCENTLGLGNKCMNADFSGPEWKGSGGLKKKSEWAQNCGVVWDGISDGRYVELSEGPMEYGMGAATTGVSYLDEFFDNTGRKVENVVTKTMTTAIEESGKQFV